MPPTSIRLAADADAATRSLFMALFTKDPTTGIHSQRVSDLATLFAEILEMPPEEVMAIQVGALLHDVGKLGVSNHILMKPGKLTPAEFEEVKRHPVIGREMLGIIGKFPRTVLDIVHFHHERVDGRGYPVGLRSSQIPIAARLVAIVDAWDAMTSLRTYRPPLSHGEAVDELLSGTDTQFDGHLVETFLSEVLPLMSNTRRNTL